MHKALLLGSIALIGSLGCDDGEETPTVFVSSEDGRVTVDGVPAEVTVTPSALRIEGVVGDIIYDLAPADTALDAPAELTFTLPESVEPPADGFLLAKVVDLRIDGAPVEQGLLQLETEIDGRVAKTRIRKLGTYAAVSPPAPAARIGELGLVGSDCGRSLEASWAHDGAGADPRDYVYLERISVPGRSDEAFPSAGDPRWAAGPAVTASLGRAEIGGLDPGATGETHYVRAWYGTKVGGPQLAKDAVPFPVVFSEGCSNPGSGDHVLRLSVSGEGAGSVRVAGEEDLLEYCGADVLPCEVRFDDPTRVEILAIPHGGGTPQFTGCTPSGPFGDACELQVHGVTDISLRFVD